MCDIINNLEQIMIMIPKIKSSWELLHNVLHLLTFKMPIFLVKKN